MLQLERQQQLCCNCSEHWIDSHSAPLVPSSFPALDTGGTDRQSDTQTAIVGVESFHDEREDHFRLSSQHPLLHSTRLGVAALHAALSCCSPAPSLPLKANSSLKREGLSKQQPLLLIKVCFKTNNDQSFAAAIRRRHPLQGNILEKLVPLAYLGAVCLKNVYLSEQ